MKRMCCSGRGWRPFVVLAALVVLFVPAGVIAGQADDYVIGPQDVLSIAVFDQSDLNGKYAVDLDGSFSFPLIGRVKAGGLTLRGVEQALKTRLADGFLKNPQVAVAVEQYRSQRVFVVGEVKNAGTYALTGQMTLIEALAKAGSTTTAAGDEVVVVRGHGAAAAVLPDAKPDLDVARVNLKDLQSGAAAAPNIALGDGDTIYVPRAELFYVFGQVKNPGAYPIASGITVLQALTLAGGVTPYAAVNRVEIQRAVNGAKKAVRVKLTEPIQAGDTIVVPERFF
jgi:polysaccharide export outer membrane protein